MAVTAHLYKCCFDSAFTKKIDIVNDVLKMMVTTSAYVPNQDTHDFKNDVTNEVSGTGYTAGGLTVSGVTLGYNSTTKQWSFGTTTPTSWGSVTWSLGRYGIVYDDTPSTAATKPLIGWVDFGQDFSPSAGVFTVTWPTTGVGYVTLT